MDPLLKLTRPEFCFWEFMVSILLKVRNGHLLALHVCWNIIFQTAFLCWINPLCLSGLCTVLTDGEMHSLHPGGWGWGMGILISLRCYKDDGHKASLQRDPSGQKAWKQDKQIHFGNLRSILCSPWNRECWNKFLGWTWSCFFPWILFL